MENDRDDAKRKHGTTRREPILSQQSLAPIASIENVHFLPPDKRTWTRTAPCAWARPDVPRSLGTRSDNEVVVEVDQHFRAPHRALWHLEHVGRSLTPHRDPMTKIHVLQGTHGDSIVSEHTMIRFQHTIPAHFVICLDLSPSLQTVDPSLSHMGVYLVSRLYPTLENVLTLLQKHQGCEVCVTVLVHGMPTRPLCFLVMGMSLRGGSENGATTKQKIMKVTHERLPALVEELALWSRHKRSGEQARIQTTCRFSEGYACENEVCRKNDLSTLLRNALHALQLVPLQVEGGKQDMLASIVFISDGVMCHYLRRAKYDNIMMHLNCVDVPLHILQVGGGYAPWSALGMVSDVDLLKSVTEATGGTFMRDYDLEDILVNQHWTEILLQKFMERESPLGRRNTANHIAQTLERSFKGILTRALDLDGVPRALDLDGVPPIIHRPSLRQMSLPLSEERFNCVQLRRYALERVTVNSVLTARVQEGFHLDFDDAGKEGQPHTFKLWMEWRPLFTLQYRVRSSNEDTHLWVAISIKMPLSKRPLARKVNGLDGEVEYERFAEQIFEVDDRIAKLRNASFADLPAVIPCDISTWHRWFTVQRPFTLFGDRDLVVEWFQTWCTPIAPLRFVCQVENAPKLIVRAWARSFIQAKRPFILVSLQPESGKTRCFRVIVATWCACPIVDYAVVDYVQQQLAALCTTDRNGGSPVVRSSSFTALEQGVIVVPRSVIHSIFDVNTKKDNTAKKDCTAMSTCRALPDASDNGSFFTCRGPRVSVLQDCLPHVEWIWRNTSQTHAQRMLYRIIQMRQRDGWTEVTVDCGCAFILRLPVVVQSQKTRSLCRSAVPTLDGHRMVLRKEDEENVQLPSEHAEMCAYYVATLDKSYVIASLYFDSIMGDMELHGHTLPMAAGIDKVATGVLERDAFVCHALGTVAHIQRAARKEHLPVSYPPYGLKKAALGFAWPTINLVKGQLEEFGRHLGMREFDDMVHVKALAREHSFLSLCSAISSQGSGQGSEYHLSDPDMGHKDKKTPLQVLESSGVTIVMNRLLSPLDAGTCKGINPLATLKRSQLSLPSHLDAQRRSISASRKHASPLELQSWRSERIDVYALLNASVACRWTEHDRGAFLCAEQKRAITEAHITFNDDMWKRFLRKLEDLALLRVKNYFLWSMGAADGAFIVSAQMDEQKLLIVADECDVNLSGKRVPDAVGSGGEGGGSGEFSSASRNLFKRVQDAFKLTYAEAMLHHLANDYRVTPGEISASFPACATVKATFSVSEFADLVAEVNTSLISHHVLTKDFETRLALALHESPLQRMSTTDNLNNDERVIYWNRKGAFLHPRFVDARTYTITAWYLSFPRKNEDLVSWEAQASWVGLTALRSGTAEDREVATLLLSVADKIQNVIRYACMNVRRYLPLDASSYALDSFFTSALKAHTNKSLGTLFVLEETVELVQKNTWKEAIDLILEALPKQQWELVRIPVQEGGAFVWVDPNMLERKKNSVAVSLRPAAEVSLLACTTTHVEDEDEEEEKKEGKDDGGSRGSHMNGGAVAERIPFWVFLRLAPEGDRGDGTINCTFYLLWNADYQFTATIMEYREYWLANLQSLSKRVNQTLLLRDMEMTRIVHPKLWHPPEGEQGLNEMFGSPDKFLAVRNHSVLIATKDAPGAALDCADSALLRKERSGATFDSPLSPLVPHRGSARPCADKYSMDLHVEEQGRISVPIPELLYRYDVIAWLTRQQEQSNLETPYSRFSLRRPVNWVWLKDSSGNIFLVVPSYESASNEGNVKETAECGVNLVLRAFGLVPLSDKLRAVHYEHLTLHLERLSVEKLAQMWTERVRFEPAALKFLKVHADDDYSPREQIVRIRIPRGHFHTLSIFIRRALLSILCTPEVDEWKPGCPLTTAMDMTGLGPSFRRPRGTEQAFAYSRKVVVGEKVAFRATSKPPISRRIDPSMDKLQEFHDRCGDGKAIVLVQYGDDHTMLPLEEWPHATEESFPFVPVIFVTDERVGGKDDAGDNDDNDNGGVEQMSVSAGTPAAPHDQLCVKIKVWHRLLDVEVLFDVVKKAVAHAHGELCAQETLKRHAHQLTTEELEHFLAQLDPILCSFDHQHLTSIHSANKRHLLTFPNWGFEPLTQQIDAFCRLLCQFMDPTVTVSTCNMEGDGMPKDLMKVPGYDDISGRSRVIVACVKSASADPLSPRVDFLLHEVADSTPESTIIRNTDVSVVGGDFARYMARQPLPDIRVREGGAAHNRNNTLHEWRWCHAALDKKGVLLITMTRQGWRLTAQNIDLALFDKVDKFITKLAHWIQLRLKTFEAMNGKEHNVSELLCNFEWLPKQGALMGLHQSVMEQIINNAAVPYCKPASTHMLGECGIPSDDLLSPAGVTIFPRFKDYELPLRDWAKVLSLDELISAGNAWLTRALDDIQFKRAVSAMQRVVDTWAPYPVLATMSAEALPSIMKDVLNEHTVCSALKYEDILIAQVIQRIEWTAEISIPVVIPFFDAMVNAGAHTTRPLCDVTAENTETRRSHTARRDIELKFGHNFANGHICARVMRYDADVSNYERAVHDFQHRFIAELEYFAPTFFRDKKSNRGCMDGTVLLYDNAPNPYTGARYPRSLLIVSSHCHVHCTFCAEKLAFVVKVHGNEALDKLTAFIFDFQIRTIAQNSSLAASVLHAITPMRPKLARSDVCRRKFDVLISGVPHYLTAPKLVGFIRAQAPDFHLSTILTPNGAPAMMLPVLDGLAGLIFNTIFWMTSSRVAVKFHYVIVASNNFWRRPAANTRQPITESIIYDRETALRACIGNAMLMLKQFSRWSAHFRFDNPLTSQRHYDDVRTFLKSGIAHDLPIHPRYGKYFEHHTFRRLVTFLQQDRVLCNTKRILVAADLSTCAIFFRLMVEKRWRYFLCVLNSNPKAERITEPPKVVKMVEPCLAQRPFFCGEFPENQRRRSANNPRAHGGRHGGENNRRTEEPREELYSILDLFRVYEKN
eukprot:GEMP01000128.1.p1 GENE.GEMP01000128.1~~GEMP01000128.1.p1  ORF type:complete len:2974 (+),score=713.48 GEMP01000128.1:165-9086(+)